MLTLIKNGLVYQAGQLQKMDVLLQDDHFAAVGVALAELGDADRVIDAAGKLVTPGFVDVHVHYRQPGFTQKETIKTGSLAAAHGGFTMVGAMPNLDPVPDTPEKMEQMQALNQKDGVVHILQYAAITKGRRGKEVMIMTP
nr:CAZy families CE9 protein [uncultured Coprococcus sp.]